MKKCKEFVHFKPWLLGEQNLTKFNNSALRKYYS